MVCQKYVKKLGNILVLLIEGRFLSNVNLWDHVVNLYGFSVHPTTVCLWQEEAKKKKKI